ncbi:Hypothetical Protein FCC1311_040802 [Hondaea fermentalgiana]|uniref:RGS domain-containing protein n=1 Tax=Hondaea fermentalgiana TaxID=2315210 RepID=A0A2R5GA12_9STRA|nr:Hypothetical Protein FCC1311_040802 [Hondaea fermentalgiana]|eukprot:GBG27857.1 Hypothetical Protein FCC1311_040802 [Hondaea fermentalgiana]
MSGVLSLEGQGEDDANAGLNGQVYVSLSLIAGIIVWLFMLAWLAVFHAYSNNRMIRIRGSWNSLGIGSLLCCACAMSSALFVNDLFASCSISVVLMVAPLVPLCHKFEIFLLRFHRLYRFNAHTSVVTSQSSEPNTSFRFRTRRNHRQELRALWAVNMFFALCMVSASALYVVSDVNRLSEDSSLQKIPGDLDKCLGSSYYLHIVLASFGMNGLVMVYLMLPIFREISMHARSAADSLGLRRALLRICIKSLVSIILLFITGFAMFFGLHVRFPVGVLALALFSIFVDVIIVPCIQAVKDMREQRMLEAAMESGDELGLDRSVSLLKAFLHSKDGYASVAGHLRKELGLETLEFIIAAVRFKRRFGKSKSGSNKSPAAKAKQTNAKSTRSVGDKNELMRSECMQIFRKYIWSKAENQINLPDMYMRKFAPLEAKRINGGLNKSTRHFAIIAGPSAVAPAPAPMPDDFIVTPTIFDESVREVLNMLFYDSFQRYLQNPAQLALWDKFQREMAHVRSLSGFQRRSSSVSGSFEDSSTPSHVLEAS